MDVLSCLKAFVSVVNHKSFSIAASSLSTSPSKLSKQVSWLEHSLKTKLLVRSTRNLVLTDAGKMVYQKALKIFQDIEGIKNLSALDIEETENIFQLYITATPAVPYITQLNIDYLKTHPNTAFHILVGSEFSNIPEKKSDIIISFSNAKQSHLYTGKLFSVRRSVYASPNYLKAHAKINKVDDLLSHNCLINTLYGLQDKWIFGEEVIQVTGNFQSNNANVLKQAALAGVGLIWAPPFSVKEELENNSLVHVLKQAKSPEFDLYYAYSRYVENMDKIKSLIKYYQESALKDVIGG